MLTVEPPKVAEKSVPTSRDAGRGLCNLEALSEARHKHRAIYGSGKSCANPLETS
jgi:hypothetical protein